MSLWKGTQSRGSRLQTLHGTETILSSSHCLSLLRPDPQVPASHIYTTNCEVRCMKRLNVKQCHTETTKTASTSVDIRPTCVYCEIIRNRSSSFFKKYSKNNKLIRRFVTHIRWQIQDKHEKRNYKPHYIQKLNQLYYNM